MHGGKTPRGIASPHFKHGRYSKALPDRLIAKYEAARTDPDLVALRDEIALIDARLQEILAALDTGEAGALWLQLQETVGDLQRARTTGDTAGIALAINDIIRIARRGAEDQQAWVEVYDLLERRRRLAESERRRLIEMQQVITSERAMVLLAAVVDVIRQNVTDRHVLSRISSDIGKLVDHKSIGAIE